jgi:predicted transcriptional regulator
MATSVHIPKPLLASLDRRARSLRVSRNRIIVGAIEKALSNDGGWSDGFFERLAAPDPTLVGAVDEMLVGIQRARGSKAPVQF